MKRTKPTKKQKQKLDQMPHGEFGGCMPNPPKDCAEPKEFIGSNGTEYINNVICLECRDGCDRRREFKNEWKEYKKRAQQIRRDLGLLNETSNGTDLVV